MIPDDERAHGVTPGLRQDYLDRSAEQQATFVLPYLHTGMSLLDVGCGPGTITMGLAKAVAPGQVVGIDHDGKHIETARALAAAQELTNVFFLSGDALSMPFVDGSFDAAFENNVFIHLAQDAVRAAQEVYRVLKPQGLFAARDANAEAIIWGKPSSLLKELDRLMIAWQQHRGSDITLGKRLPAILREAGFANTLKSVSADTKGTSKSVRSHADLTISLLNGPFGREILNNGWAGKSTLERLQEGILAWAEHPDAFFANVHIEVIGWKPG